MSRHIFPSKYAKVYVLHENEEWLPPLRNAMDKLDVQFEEWYLDVAEMASFDFTSAPPHGIFYNRMSASSHTRNHRFAAEFTGCILAWLEAYNRVIVNSTKSLELELNKVKQYSAFQRHGIQSPKTLVACGRKSIAELAKELDPPFITKHNRAGKGLGIKLFRSHDELAMYVNSDSFEDSVDGITLLQQYIECPGKYITRLEFCNGRLSYALRISTESASFENCPADTCELKLGNCPTEKTKAGHIPKFSIHADSHQNHDIVKKAGAMFKEYGIDICGIEFITDVDGNYFAFDMNMNTNYNQSAERRHGLDLRETGMGRLATFLGHELDSLNRKLKN